MEMFCKILGIVIAIPNIILSIIWIINFPKKAKELSEISMQEENDETVELNISKQFFKQAEKLFLINFPAFIVSVFVFILNIILCDGIPFYPAPLIIALCGGVCAFIALDVFIKSIGAKYKIKVLNKFNKKIYPIGFASVAITCYSIVVGFLFAEVIACAVYMILLMI